MFLLSFGTFWKERQHTPYKTVLPPDTLRKVVRRSQSFGFSTNFRLTHAKSADRQAARAGIATRSGLVPRDILGEFARICQRSANLFLARFLMFLND